MYIYLYIYIFTCACIYIYIHEFMCTLNILILSNMFVYIVIIHSSKAFSSAFF